MDYVKVVNNEVVEFYSPRNYANNQVPNGSEWLPLYQEKPALNNKKEFLVHSHYEIFNNKVVEHFIKKEINIYYAKVNDVSELETEGIRNGTKALVGGEVYIFRKKQWQPL